MMGLTRRYLTSRLWVGCADRILHLLNTLGLLSCFISIVISVHYFSTTGTMCLLIPLTNSFWFSQNMFPEQLLQLWLLPRPSVRRKRRPRTSLPTSLWVVIQKKHWLLFHIDFTYICFLCIYPLLWRNLSFSTLCGHRVAWKYWWTCSIRPGCQCQHSCCVWHWWIRIKHRPRLLYWHAIGLCWCHCCCAWQLQLFILFFFSYLWTAA